MEKHKHLILQILSIIGRDDELVLQFAEQLGLSTDELAAILEEIN